LDVSPVAVVFLADFRVVLSASFVPSFARLSPVHSTTHQEILG
jgi:hypothetical protein